MATAPDRDSIDWCTVTTAPRYCRPLTSRWLFMVMALGRAPIEWCIVVSASR